MLQEGLKENLRYKSNRKILSVYPFYLQAWNFSYDGRDTSKIREFVREKVGEEPVLLDSAAIEKSKEQLKLYLFNNGYFNAEVSYAVKMKRSRAHLTYSVTLGKAYTLNAINLHIYDKDVFKAVEGDRNNSLVQEGQRFNTEALSEERNRLETMLRNRGYFGFTREFLAFDVDTNNGNYTLDLAIVIKNPSLHEQHNQYTIDAVKLKVNYLYFLSGKDDSSYHNVDGILVNTMGFPMNHEALARLVRIKPGSLYTENDFKATYNSFLGLQVVKSLNFFVQVDTLNKLLDVSILMEPEEKDLEFSIEPQAITSDQSSAVQASNRRIWGFSSQILLRDINAFRGGEIFDIRLGNSAEFQYAQKRFNFSNFEQSISSSIIIPKLWLLERNVWLKKYEPEQGWRQAATSFNLSFSYEFNQDFVQRTALFTWAYSFANRFNTFRFVPAEVNLNQVKIRQDLIDSLGPGDRVLLASILNPNFIPAMRIEWQYDDAGLSPTGSYHFFRWNILELSGNLWALGFQAAGAEKPYTIFNTNLFQYVKSEFDLRYYSRPKRDVNSAFRIRVGAALPWGNSRVIPFDKRYFIGGANSLRGWRPRTIGPGAYAESSATQLDRSGELVIEGSAELRFKIIEGLLKGAIFADGGNIWNVNADPALPNAHFEMANFYKQFALNSGIGLRFDFSFFLVRFDLGTQLRDPAYPKDNGWVLNDYNYLGRRIAFNFGIGYPF